MLEVLSNHSYRYYKQQYFLLFSAYMVVFAQEQNILKSVEIFLPLKH